MSAQQIVEPNACPAPAGGAQGVRVSFEFFPPGAGAGREVLRQTLGVLAPLGPDFMSVTYGAGGSTRDRTLEIASRIAGTTGVPVAGHLTCVGASRAQVDAVAVRYWEAGVRHIVALRGDMPDPATRFAPHPQGYRNGAELVAGLKRLAPFEISVAAYPERHPESSGVQADLDNLKAKLDAGADRAITQFFFAADTFHRFRDAAAAAGIAAEIVPGILPVINASQTRQFAQRCGASFPGWLRRLFDGVDDPALQQAIGAGAAAALCRDLYAEGARNFHFYTLNRPEVPYALCRLLGRHGGADMAAAEAA